MEAQPGSEKRYYTMGEVARILGVNPSLIRFWEKEFDILELKKNRKGNRIFAPRDLENIKLIYHLVKERGFTLKGAQAKLRENREDTARIAEAVARLKNVKQALAELKKGLD